MASSCPSRSHGWRMAVLVGLFSLAIPAAGLPMGAPTSTCQSLTPGHGEQQTEPSPYTITVSEGNYTEGSTITVNVSGRAFQGILMQMRMVGQPGIVGTWTSLAPNTKNLQCNAAKDSVTHSNTSSKENAQFTWTAPTPIAGDVQVTAVIAETMQKWWKNVTSERITSTRGENACGKTTGGLFMVVTALAMVVAKLHF